MIKIFMLPSWTGDADHMRRLFIRQTPNCSGVWNGIKVAEKEEDADFLIQMDKPEKGLSCPEKTIYMNWEPPVKGGHYLCEDYDVFGRILMKDNPFPAMWFLDYTYDELKVMPPPKKNKKLSCVLSNKRKCKGHKIRHKFAKKMCEEFPKDFELYGSVRLLDEFREFNVKEASSLTKLGKRGNFFDKTEPLKDYRYHLTMENCQYNNYFTEKVTDALLMWSLPIYWGCQNIYDFLPKGSMVIFDAEELKESKRVMEISNDENLYYNSLEHINVSRNLILDKYNFCNLIWEFINKI